MFIASDAVIHAVFHRTRAQQGQIRIWFRKDRWQNFALAILGSQ